MLVLGSFRADLALISAISLPVIQYGKEPTQGQRQVIAWPNYYKYYRCYEQFQV